MLAARICSVLALSLVGCTCHSEAAAPLAQPVGEATTPRSSVDPPATDGSIAISLTSSGASVLASWVEPSGTGAQRIRFATFDAASATWSGAVTVAEGPDVLANSVELPTTARTEDGTLFLAFLRSGTAEEASSVHLATSRDGVGWRLLGPVHDDGTDTEHAHVSLLAEERGVRLVWLDGRTTVESGPTAVRTALFGADGVRVAEDVLDDRVCDCCQTAAALTADGAVVVYRDRSADERRDLAIVRRTGGTWSEPTDLSADGWNIRGCPVNGPQVAADGRRVVAAWYTEGGGAPRIRVAFSVDAGRQFAAPIDLDDARPLGRVDVEWTDDGSALVAWLGRRDDGEAHVLVRRVGRDRRVGDPSEIAALGAPAAFGAPRLARLGADLMVAWSDPGPPRRVRATVLRAAEIPPLAGEPLAAGTPSATDTLGPVPPDVSLTTLSGEARSIGSFRGRPLVLSFFATWCVPCREEIPVLSRVADRHGDSIAVVGVSIDETPPESVAQFTRQHGITYPVLHDPAGASLGGAVGVPPIPATVVLDAEGRVVFAARGGSASLEEDLHRALEELLATEPHTHTHAH
ncbi:MAG: redoxin family protein [Deltaproteobacteria bacterium]|nr:redoxin family protein [Deltaproteobacteria bacterium]